MVQSSLFMCSKFVDSKSLTEHRPLTLSHLFICFELSFPLPLIKWITWLAFELLFSSPLVSGKALDGEIASEWVFPASHAGKVAQGGELLQYRWKPRTTQVLESRDCCQSLAVLFETWRQACLLLSAQERWFLSAEVGCEQLPTAWVALS